MNTLYIVQEDEGNVRREQRCWVKDHVGPGKSGKEHTTFFPIFFSLFSYAF